MSPSGNPVLDEIDQHHAALSEPAKRALSIAATTGQPPAPDTNGLVRPAVPAEANPPSMAEQPLPMNAAPTARTTPNVPAPPPTVAEQHQANLAHLTTGPTAQSGISQIHNPFLRTLGHIGEIAASAITPGLTPLIPGTEAHHGMLVHRAQGAVQSDEEQQAAADKSRLEQAKAVEQESLPELHKTQAELAATKVTNKQDLDQANLALHQTDEQRKTAEGQAKDAATLTRLGYKHDETGKLVPLSYDEMSEEQKGVHDLKGAQTEQAEATAALKKAQAANQPAAAALAQKRLDSANEAHSIALRRLGLSEKTFEARYHGTEGGVPLPGSLVGDDGQTVGTAFQQNVRPTGQARNKGTLATSAHEQIQDMRSIIQKRPDVFGPLAGRKTDLEVWLGSQDPDAQKFIAARTLAADHAAGVFGGRSEEALKELNAALGKFKDNPAAGLAGLDQFDKANATFMKAGKVNTSGSGNAPGGKVEEWVRDSTGKLVKK